MDDTGAIREKLTGLWAKFDSGKISGQEARTHIGFARAILETKKVEIAAAHLSMAEVPAVSLRKPMRTIGARRPS